jgi:DNA-binding NarL/FixJ family response regulator
VRTHLHNVYGKLGAMDRAQAVLMATDRGWI